MGSRAQRPWFRRLEQTEQWQQIEFASTPATSDTFAAAILKENSNVLEAMAIVHNSLILSQVFPNSKCFLNFQRQNKGAPDINRAKPHMEETSTVNALSLLSPSLIHSCISDFACSDDVRAHSYTSQAGDKRIVQIISCCKVLKNKSRFIYYFLCSYSRILNGCQNAVPILWDMLCSWASHRSLTPARKTSTNWSILMTTLPTNTFKWLWPSFSSIRMLCK